VNRVDKKQTVEAALKGLDFLVRHQVTDDNDANFGRFVCQYDYIQNKYTGKEAYLDAAQRAVKYLAALQFFGPDNDRMRGMIREITPQTTWAHPRDALTAAWAMLDWSQHAGQQDYFERSRMFAEWFLNVAMEKGYPYWTVLLDDGNWHPEWCGSFHSGSAF
jgi:hypothetical protein